MAKKSRAEKFAERAAAEAAAMAKRDDSQKHMSKYALKKIAQQNAERSGNVYVSAGAAAKAAEDAAAEEAKIRALTQDPDLIEHDLPATDRSYAMVARATEEGVNGIEHPGWYPRGEAVQITVDGEVVTVYLRQNEEPDTVPEWLLIDRYKKEQRRKLVRASRKVAMTTLRKKGFVRGTGSRTRIVIPRKLQLERKVIETFGVETRDRLPDLYDPKERRSSTYKHNRPSTLLLTPIKRYLPPVHGRDPIAAFLDRWSRTMDPQGIFAEAFAEIKKLRRTEDGFARIGIIAFLKFLEGIPKGTITDDYALDLHLYIKRREVTGFINAMKEPAMRWAKERQPYEENYAFVYFDTYPVHIHLGKTRVICIQLLMVIGVTLDGRKDLLAAIPDLAPGRLSVEFWEDILNYFKSLGMNEICFVVASTRCRYLDLAVNRVFPNASMQYNLQEVLQHDSYSLEAQYRKAFMADVAELLEAPDYDAATKLLETMRAKWEPLMADGKVILQGNIEYLRLHTMLPSPERRVLNSQKTVSAAAAMIMGQKAINDHFSDNAEIIVYIFYRYLLLAKPYWLEHQDEAVHNLTYSRIFSALRRCDVRGAELLNRLLGEQHESFMLRHFGSFGNGPVFNLNPARKRISLSGHIDNNTYAQNEMVSADASGEGQSSAKYSNAAGTASNYISVGVEESDAALATYDKTIDASTAATATASVAAASAAADADASDAAADTTTASEDGEANELSVAAKALQAISNYERIYNGFAQDPQQDASDRSSLTLISSTQSAVIPLDEDFDSPFASAAANALTQGIIAQLSTADGASKDTKAATRAAKPSRLAQAVYKENRLNFSGSFNGLDMTTLTQFAPLGPAGLISGSQSPLSDDVFGTFGFTSVAVSPESGSRMHKSSAVREALAMEFNAASKAAAEAKLAAARAEREEQKAERAKVVNLGVEIVPAASLGVPQGESATKQADDKDAGLEIQSATAEPTQGTTQGEVAAQEQAPETTQAASYERVYTETTHNDFALAKVAQNADVAVSYSVDDDNGSGASISPDETLSSNADYTEFKDVQSNIQSANTVLGVLRPSVARALRDELVELKKEDRALIYECLGEDFDFIKIEDVAHNISPIFRATINTKNAERHKKRAEEKEKARLEPKRRAHRNYLKRQALKAEKAKEEAARFGPYSADALIPVASVKNSARQKLVIDDASLGAEVKDINSIVPDVGFDANRVVAKTNFSSGAPTTQLSAAERNLTASAKEMYTLLDKFDPSEGQIGSLTLSNASKSDDIEPSLGLNISSVASHAAQANATADASSASANAAAPGPESLAPSAAARSNSLTEAGGVESRIASTVANAIDGADAAATYAGKDAAAQAEEAASSGVMIDEETGLKKLRGRRGAKPTLNQLQQARVNDLERKKQSKEQARQKDAKEALKNAARISPQALLNDEGEGLSITPVAEADVQLVPDELRNQVYEEFNLPPGIQTAKPQRVRIKKTKSATTLSGDTTATDD